MDALNEQKHYYSSNGMAGFENRWFGCDGVAQQQKRKIKRLFQNTECRVT
jgi:hypothetical protein